MITKIVGFVSTILRKKHVIHGRNGMSGLYHANTFRPILAKQLRLMPLVWEGNVIQHHKVEMILATMGTG
jgi:hypothetical protein